MTSMKPVKKMKLLEEPPESAKDDSEEQPIIGPSPPTQIPALYLPPEVQHSILSQITDTSTLKNCCVASSHLSSLLHRRKPTFLFPDILPFIYGLGKNCVHHHSLLELRLVCKTWKNSVDAFIQNHPSKKAYSSEYHLAQMNQSPSISQRFNYYLDPYSISRYSFQNRLSPDNQSLSRFRQEYNHLSSVIRAPLNQFNPFVGRSLILTLNMDIDFWEYGQITLYVGDLTLFIEQFGRHLYHLTLRITQNPLLAYCIFRDLDSFLQFLPNLRSLSIYTVPLFQVFRDDLVRRLEPDFFRRIPELYPLDHLESISVYHTMSKPELITSLLLEPYIGKLSRVSIPFWEDGLETKLPNLKELSLTWLSCNRDLERLAEVEADNLEKLRLQFRWRRVSVKALKKCLLKFRGSLKYLELDWCGYEVEAEGKTVLLRGGVPKGDEETLGKVHTLKLSHALGVDYGFLRWLPGLERLYLGEKVLRQEEGVGMMEGPRGRMKKIWEKMVEKEGKAGGVEIHKYLWDLQNMYHSNVWTICDKLWMIKFNRFRLEEVGGEEGHRIQEGIDIVWYKKLVMGKEREK